MYICMLFRFFSIMGYNKMLSIVVHAVGLCCLSILYMCITFYLLSELFSIKQSNIQFPQVLVNLTGS